MKGDSEGYALLRRRRFARRRRARPQYPGARQDLVPVGVVGKDVEDDFAVATAAAPPLHALHQAGGPRRPQVTPAHGPPVRAVAAELIDHP